LNSWHHIAVTYSHMTRTKSLYIDGRLASSTTCGNAGNFTPNTTGGITVGAYWGSCACITNFFTGDMDDLRVYGRALSQGDIQELAALGQICPTTPFLSEGLGSTPLGQVPTTFTVRFPGDIQTVSSPVHDGANSLKMRAAPFAAVEIQSAQTYPVNHGVAMLRFSVFWSSASNNDTSDCADATVSYVGSRGVFTCGLARPSTGVTGTPMLLAGTTTTAQPDRWYNFMALADFDRRTVSIFLDSQYLTCVPMQPGETDATRTDRVALHTGCIDSGQLIAYFDDIQFLPPAPTCVADINRDGFVSVQDIFDFLAAYFGGC
jgi:hypothetical protein